LCPEVTPGRDLFEPDKSAEPEVDFWLGDRGEGKVTDFDGRLRACRILKRVKFSSDYAAAHLLVHVDPPLPFRSGKTGDRVVLGPRWEGRALDNLPANAEENGVGYLAVDIFEVLNEQSTARGEVGPPDLRFDWYGEIALRPELLPPTQEEVFDSAFRLFQRFVAREGHADVPLDHREGDLNLGVWVSNLKFEQANMGIRQDWASLLESLPGWKWLPGNDFFLVERYVRREGTSWIPIDHVEEGRPLGRWVAQQRRVHASGQLAKDWVARLEQIPGWEW
jgi:hypothetical protein